MILEIIATTAIVILAVYFFIRSLHKKSGDGCSCGCDSCKISDKCSDRTSIETKK